jgi:hypothetical protein
MMRRWIDSCQDVGSSRWILPASKWASEPSGIVREPHLVDSPGSGRTAILRWRINHGERGGEILLQYWTRGNLMALVCVPSLATGP